MMNRIFASILLLIICHNAHSQTPTHGEREVNMLPFLKRLSSMNKDAFALQMQKSNMILLELGVQNYNEHYQRFYERNKIFKGPTFYLGTEQLYVERNLDLIGDPVFFTRNDSDMSTMVCYYSTLDYDPISLINEVYNDGFTLVRKSTVSYNRRWNPNSFEYQKGKFYIKTSMLPTAKIFGNTASGKLESCNCMWLYKN